MRQFPFRTRQPWTMERCQVRQSGALKPVKFRTEQRRSISARRKQRYVLTLITPFDPFSFHRDISGYQQLGIHCQRASFNTHFSIVYRDAFHNVSVNETILLSFIPQE